MDTRNRFLPSIQPGATRSLERCRHRPSKYRTVRSHAASGGWCSQAAQQGVADRLGIPNINLTRAAQLHGDLFTSAHAANYEEALRSLSAEDGVRPPTYPSCGRSLHFRVCSTQADGAVWRISWCMAAPHGSSTLSLLDGVFSSLNWRLRCAIAHGGERGASHVERTPLCFPSRLSRMGGGTSQHFSCHSISTPCSVLPTSSSALQTLVEAGDGCITNKLGCILSIQSFLLLTTRCDYPPGTRQAPVRQ